jgi:hypothetical protein
LAWRCDGWHEGGLSDLACVLALRREVLDFAMCEGVKWVHTWRL